MDIGQGVTSKNSLYISQNKLIFLYQIKFKYQSIKI